MSKKILSHENQLLKYLESDLKSGSIVIFLLDIGFPKHFLDVNPRGYSRPYLIRFDLNTLIFRRYSLEARITSGNVLGITTKEMTSKGIAPKTLCFIKGNERDLALEVIPVLHLDVIT